MPLSKAAQEIERIESLLMRIAKLSRFSVAEFEKGFKRFANIGIFISNKRTLPMCPRCHSVNHIYKNPFGGLTCRLCGTTIYIDRKRERMKSNE